MSRKIWKTAGIAVGVLTTVSGILVMAAYKGMTPMTDVTGSDYYSYMYQAASYGAYNALMIERTVSFGFGFLLISLGLSEICFFAMKQIGGDTAENEAGQETEAVQNSIDDRENDNNAAEPEIAFSRVVIPEDQNPESETEIRFSEVVFPEEPEQEESVHLDLGDDMSVSVE